MKMKLILPAFLFFAFGMHLQMHAQDCIAVKYEMNGNAQNAIGNYSHGVAMGGMTNGTDQTGAPNSGYDFDGIDDYIVCNNNQPIVTTTTFTISVWAKGASGFSGNLPLFSQRNLNTLPASAGSTICMFASLNGKYSFQLRSDNWTNLPLFVSEASVATPESWHLYVAVKDENMMRTFVDGVLIDSTAFTDSDEFMTSIDYVEIGKHTFDGPGNTIFEGSMNDFRIYNCALDHKEVMGIYQENFVDIENVMAPAEMTVYPNPVTNMLYIQNDGAKGKYSISLLSSEGKLLNNFNFSGNTFSIDMTNYAAGIYYVQIKDIETAQLLSPKKLIKQ